MTATESSIFQRLAALPDYGRARITAGADALVRLRTQAPALAELPVEERRFWLRDAQAVLDAAGMADVLRELSRERQRTRIASQGATAAEADAAESEARAQSLAAEVARLRAVDARRQVDVDDLRARLAAAKALVGETGQPGWDNVDRAEAIRQAESFHETMMVWASRHDERRRERDLYADLLRRVLNAATGEDTPPEALADLLAQADAELNDRVKPRAGDRMVDGGEAGVLVTCDTCSGLGLLHQPDTPPRPGVKPMPEPVGEGQ